MVRRALRRGRNVVPHAYTVDRDARQRLKGQQAKVLWLTGLPGAGKSTIANALERRLHAMGLHTYVLDGDNVRSGLNKDLGFTLGDRAENVRRVAELTRILLDAGLRAPGPEGPVRPGEGRHAAEHDRARPGLRAAGASRHGGRRLRFAR